MFKNKFFIGITLSIIIVTSSFQYYKYSEENLHKRIAKSEDTMMRTDSIRFSFKVVVMLQKSFILLNKAVANQDEDMFYEALDYIRVSQGFLHMEYIQNENLVLKVDPILEKIYNKIESAGMKISEAELDEIYIYIAFVEKQMHVAEKDIWIEFQKNYIEFQTNEYKLDIFYKYVILFISLLLVVFILVFLRQRRLNKKILENENKLKNLAYYDALTQIPNRKSIELIISKRIEVTKRKGIEFFIALIDLDDFKKVNDMHGHESGDILLLECVKRIKSSIRSIDEIGRFGGDEFIIIFESINDKSELINIFNRINNSFNEPINIGIAEHYTNVSIGVSCYPKDADNISDLIKYADITMYHSKLKGKAQYNFFESRLSNSLKRQYEMEPQIKDALKLDQFELYYQPQIENDSNSVASVEALVRWNHPTKGFISPIEFIDIIEKGYMTKEFGEWVIRKASKQQKDWLKKGVDINVSVNLSVKHIMMPTFYKDMLNLVSELDIDLKHFSFEITEYELLTYKERSVKVLNDLATKEFNFYLDDFGTGYSSITYLNEVDIKAIKIDKSFIDKIVTKKDDRHFVDAIVNMAKALNIKIIAEGVENEVQRDYLKEIECDLIQGYFYSKPLSSDDFENYFKNFSI